MTRWLFPAALALILAGVAAAHWQGPVAAPGAAHMSASPAPRGAGSR